MNGIVLDLVPKPGMLVQDPKHKRDVFARLTLPNEIKKRCMFIKLEGLGDDSNVHHSKSPKEPWVIQCIEHNKVDLIDEDGDMPYAMSEGGGITEDAGLIMTFHGTWVADVAINPENGLPLEENRVSMIEDLNPNTQLVRKAQFDFHLHEVVYTDGPARRERLSEDADNQRARAEEESHKAQQKFYESQMEFQRANTAMLLAVIEKLQGAGAQKVDVSALKEALVTPEPAAEVTIENEDMAAAQELIREAAESPKVPRKVLDIEVTAKP